MSFSRDIELEGHIMDSGIIEKVLDTTLDMDGDFEIHEVIVGKKKTDTSFARITIIANSPEKLEMIISRLHRHGARLVDNDDVTLLPAEGPGIVPKGFYSTTNYPTQIKSGGTWIKVDSIEMDNLIIVSEDKKTAKTIPMSKLHKGDLVVIGEKGVKIRPPERSRTQEEFEFMGGDISSERPTRTTIQKIAKEILDTHEKGLKIGLVGGPAIIHTGAVESVAGMFREGFLDVLFAGNALATHDIEYSLFGTSLGMDLKRGELAVAGHKNHIYAISEVMRAGSIKNAVNTGIIKSGIMYECIKNNIPFVLAGSIRDDGPLPDVIQNTMEAQDAMRRYIPEFGMVLMVATMLHSVAVGNCLPAYVKTVCVDINPSTLTKLMDRGTTQAIGIVSDAGAFFPILYDELKKLQKN